MTPRKVLQTVFGYDTFREHQEAVIAHLLGGSDAFVLMPTGSGKSLCYQIPSVVRDGVGVVISPLIALMHDQVTALRENGVRADGLNSSLPPEEAAQVEARVRSGETDILYVAPERLLTPRLPAAAGRDERRPVRHRRGPLRLPMGPRFPARIPQDRRGHAPFPGRTAHCPDRHGRRGHPAGDRGETRARRRPAPLSPASTGPISATGCA